MLDVLTARVILTVVALSVLVLFYVGTYRKSGSRYAAWWCVALLVSGLATAAYSIAGVSWQAVFMPLGNLLAVTGTGFVWFAARAVRGRAPRWWVVAVLVAITGIATAVDSPSQDAWAGGAFLLAAMTVTLGLATGEILLMAAERRALAASESHAGTQIALMSMGVGAGGLTVFYLGRLAAYLAIGPDDPVFIEWFGTAISTILLTVLLVVATFSVSEISHFELNREYRRRASHDDLTGVLTRGEFLARAEAWLDSHSGTAYAFMADLDHFKSLNDALGHAAGDRALRAFGAACRKAVEGTGIAGRVGGEEFALLIDALDLAHARAVAEQISAVYADDAPIRLGTPTVSYGVAQVLPGEAVFDALARADEALYRAKRAGRDRFEVAEAPAA